MHRLNWDNLKFVLAVVEEGSLAGAARRLGVNHATVLRRVAAFESHIGSTVFLRTAQGYQIRPEKLRLITAAREVATAVQSVERLGAGKEPRLAGPVHITSTDTVCLELMPSLLEELRAREKGVHVSMFASNTHLDLARLQAEISVRPAASLPDELVGDCAAQMRFHVYRAAQTEYEDGWIGVCGPLEGSRPGTWLEDRCAQDGMIAQADSFLVLRELAAKGIGRTILPCFIAEHDPRLVRDDSMALDMTVPLWVASHENLADVHRLRHVRRQLVDGLARRTRLLDPD